MEKIVRFTFYQCLLGKPLKIKKQKNTYENIIGHIWFFVIGTSSPTGKFFACGAVLSSHEDDEAWTAIFEFARNLSVEPNFVLGDGAETIFNVCRILKPLKRAFQIWSYMPKTSISKGITSILNKTLKLRNLSCFSED